MTEQTQNQLEKILSIKNLSTEKIYWNEQDTGKFVVKDDNGELFGTVGKNYVPLAHGDFYHRVREWLPEGKVVSCLGGGFKGVSKAVINIELPTVENVNGQKIGVYLNLLNSLGGETPVILSVSPYRYACMNMFSLGRKNGYSPYIRLKQHHTVKGLELFNKEIPLVEQVYNIFKGQVELCRQLANKEITTEKGKEFLKRIEEKKILPKTILKSANELWENPTREEDKERNFWILFNCVTDPINRKIEDKKKVTSFKQLEIVDEQFSQLV